ncbi:MAG: NAD-dependent epimerase/dehydratase family protein [Promethearchaeota archaeon]
MNEQKVFLNGASVGVTGANGFVGSHVCEVLAGKGAEIHAFVYPGTETTNIVGFVERSGGTVREVDVTRPSTLEGEFDGLEYLFHVAGTVAEWARPRSKIFDVNFRGALNVHSAAKRAGVQRTVHTSSMAACGSCPDPYPAVTSEDAPYDLQATGPYSLSKYLGERVAVKFHGGEGPGAYQTIRVRPHQVLGWGDTGPSVPGQLVLQAITRGFPAYVDQVTQVVHVGDVAAAHVAAMERGTPGSVYNIASERPVPAYNFLQYACEVAGAKPPARVPVPKRLLLVAATLLEALSDHITHRPPPLTRGNARLMYKNTGTSIERARRELGFQPKPWREAVDEAVRWFTEGYSPRQH